MSDGALAYLAISYSNGLLVERGVVSKLYWTSVAYSYDQELTSVFSVS